jgi:formylmethanofuran dehydrogenase subunit E-like metal-binding protein
LSFIDKTNKDKYKTIKIVELKNNLSKEEFDKLLSQEDKYLLVDRNTIIDRDTSSKVKVYTRQSGILHVDSAESVFEKPICIRK